MICAAVFSSAGCAVEPVCFNDADCGNDQVCRVLSGDRHGQCKGMCQDDSECPDGEICAPLLLICQPPDCFTDAECEPGFACKDHGCVSVNPLNCPEEMVSVEDRFCIDIYEASRIDATDRTPGSTGDFATSRPGVLPWEVNDNAEAETACGAAGKRLCTEAEWASACGGPDNTVYGYGDLYDPSTCNGIDTHCNCFPADACGDRSPCPYPGCYQDCGAGFRLEPTGFRSGCRNGLGAFDMNGNLWEHVQGGNSRTVRGGAYNCADSVTFHRCDYIPIDWTPSALGFRCCSWGNKSDDGGTGDKPDSGSGG